MKNDPVIGALVVTAALSALLSVVLLLFYYVPPIREKLSLEGSLLNISGRSRAVTMLVNDALIYSQTHTNIDPVLESMGAKAPKTTNKPAGK